MGLWCGVGGFQALRLYIADDCTHGPVVCLCEFSPSLLSPSGLHVSGKGKIRTLKILALLGR